MKRLTREEVIDALKQGADLWYFYLDGGVAIHQNGRPTETSCPIDVFLNLRETGFIERSRQNGTGYPFYANNAKSDVYKIKPQAGAIHETADYTDQYDPEAEREHGPDNDLEVYYREGNEADEIRCTTAEREDFEEETGIRLDADVIPSDHFDAMVASLFPVKSDAEYLRGLAERLMNVPAMYGTDQSDVDRLGEIAGRMETV